MSHLGERITDYLLDEMTELERTQADAHIRQCPECATQVEGFKSLYFRLQAVPASEPPRRLVFETGKKAAPTRFWTWLSPAVSAVAASVLTVIFLAPPSTPPATAPAPQWLAAELDKRDTENNNEIKRLRSEIDYWESQQRAASRESFVTARSIQLLAQKQASLREE